MFKVPSPLCTVDGLIIRKTFVQIELELTSLDPWLCRTLIEN